MEQTLFFICITLPSPYIHTVLFRFTEEEIEAQRCEIIQLERGSDGTGTQPGRPAPESVLITAK